MMVPMRPLVLVTGFEPFEEHATNPSAAVARGLATAPPAGVDVVAAELPVSYRGVPAALDEALAGLDGRRPALYLGLGVQPRDGFRLEARARVRLTRRGRPDNDGVDAVVATAEREGPDEAWSTRLDAGALALALLELAPEPAGLSWDAGGYVCEFTYGELLARAATHDADALFIHVPLEHCSPVPIQVERIRDVLVEALRQVGAGTRGGG